MLDALEKQVDGRAAHSPSGRRPSPHGAAERRDASVPHRRDAARRWSRSTRCSRRRAALDDAGFDTIWLAEAYPWWRKHGMEARSSTVVVGADGAATPKRLTVGWGIISPYTRHPVQAAMDARVVQEAAGPGRFIAGFGTSKIFLNNTKQGGPPKDTKPLAHDARLGRDRARRARGRAVLLRRQGRSAPTSRRCGGRARAALGRAGLRGRRPRR